jgi:hypothetical protein
MSAQPRIIIVASHMDSCSKQSSHNPKGGSLREKESIWGLLKQLRSHPNSDTAIDVSVGPLEDTGFWCQQTREEQAIRIRPILHIVVHRVSRAVLGFPLNPVPPLFSRCMNQRLRCLHGMVCTVSSFETFLVDHFSGLSSGCSRCISHRLLDLLQKCNIQRRAFYTSPS